MAASQVVQSLVIALNANIQGLQQGLQQAAAAVALWSQNVRTRLRAFEEGALLAGAAAAAIVAPLILASKAFGRFRDVLNEIEGLGATADEVNQLGDAAMRLGPSAGGPIRAAEGLKELGKAGMTVTEQLDAMPGVILLSKAATIELGEAGETVAGILRGFRMEMNQAAEVADQLAMAANSSAIDISHLQLSFKYIAPVAASSNQSLSEMSGILAALGNQMIRGEQAGTTMRSVLVSLQNPSGDAAKTLNKLGISIQDVRGRMLPLSDIINQLRERTAKMTEVQRSAAIATVFGQEAISGVLALLGMTSKEIEEYIRKQDKATGSSQAMADAMAKGPNYQLKQLASMAETAGIKFGKILAPAIETTAKAARGLLSVLANMPDWLQTLIVAAAGLTAGVLALVAGLGAFAAALPALSGLFTALTTTMSTGLALALNPWTIGIVAATAAIGYFAIKLAEAREEQERADAAMAKHNQEFGRLATVAIETEQKRAKGLKVTAKEAREAAVGLRLLATNNTDPAQRAELVKRAEAMTKYFKELQKVEEAEKKRGKVVDLPGSDKVDPALEKLTGLELERARNSAGMLKDAELLKKLKAEQLRQENKGLTTTKGYLDLRAEVLGLEQRITREREQQDRDDRAGKLSAAREELEKNLLINEKYGGGVAGRVKWQEKYIADLKAAKAPMLDILRAERELLNIKDQGAEAAERERKAREAAAKAAFDQLKALGQGLAQSLSSEQLDELKAKADGMRADIAAMEAEGAEPADIINKRRDLANMQRDINRGERDQANAMPAFIANNAEALMDLPEQAGKAAEHLAAISSRLSQASGVVVEGITKFGGFIQGALSSMPAFTGFLGQLGGLASGILPALSAAGSAVVGALAPLAPIIAAVALAFATLQQMWQSNAGGIHEAITNLMTVFGYLWQAIMQFVEPLSAVLGPVIAILVNTFSALLAIVTGVWQALMNAQKAIWDFFMSLGPIKWLVDGLGAVFKALWDGLAAFVEWITFGNVKLRGSGDNAKARAKEEADLLAEDRGFAAQLKALNPDSLGKSVGNALKEALMSFTSYNPLPVEEVSKGGFFSAGPVGRFMVEREVRMSLDLNLNGGTLDKGQLMQLAQDPDVRSAFESAVSTERGAQALVPRISF